MKDGVEKVLKSTIRRRPILIQQKGFLKARTDDNTHVFSLLSVSKIYVSLSFYFFMKGMVNVAAVQQLSYGYT